MEIINFVNGTTPAINDTNLNKIQNNIKTDLDEINSSITTINKKNKVKQAILKITSQGTKGQTVTLPIKYGYGDNSLEIYLFGEKLIKCNGTDETTGHYLEVKASSGNSNQIKLTNDWLLDTGDVLEIITRGEYN